MRRMREGAVSTETPPLMTVLGSSVILLIFPKLAILPNYWHRSMRNITVWNTKTVWVFLSAEVQIRVMISHSYLGMDRKEK